MRIIHSLQDSLQHTVLTILAILYCRTPAGAQAALMLYSYCTPTLYSYCRTPAGAQAAAWGCFCTVVTGAVCYLAALRIHSSSPEALRKESRLESRLIEMHRASVTYSVDSAAGGRGSSWGSFIRTSTASRSQCSQSGDEDISTSDEQLAASMGGDYESL
jgi:hypothetical protein